MGQSSAHSQVRNDKDRMENIRALLASTGIGLTQMSAHSLVQKEG